MYLNKHLHNIFCIVGQVEEGVEVEVEEVEAEVTVAALALDTVAAPAPVVTPSQLELSVPWSRDLGAEVRTASMNKNVVR